MLRPNERDIYFFLSSQRSRYVTFGSFEREREGKDGCVSRAINRYLRETLPPSPPRASGLGPRRLLQSDTNEISARALELGPSGP